MTSPTVVYAGYTRDMVSTTVKVPSDLRDRLNSEARSTGSTVAQVIEALFADRDRLERFRAIRAARAEFARSAEDIAEDSLWESTSVADLAARD